MAFDITITFNKQTACVRVALTGEDYSDKPLKALLAQINVHAANEVSGAYTIVGLSQGGASRNLPLHFSKESAFWALKTPKFSRGRAERARLRRLTRLRRVAPRGNGGKVGVGVEVGVV